MALYKYLRALLFALRVAWSDRFEDEDERHARLEALAGEIVNAVEAAWPGDLETQRAYAVTLVELGWRETTLRRDKQHACYRDRGVDGTDYGIACGPLSLHGPGTISASLAVLRSNPGAWCLPRVTPWYGLPSAARYLAEHPLVVRDEEPARAWPTEVSVAQAP